MNTDRCGFEIDLRAAQQIAAPKAQDMKAQGNALGNGCNRFNQP